MKWKKSAWACAALLVCTSLAVADGGLTRTLNLTITDEHGQLLPEATPSIEAPGSSETPTIVDLGNGVWQATGFDQKLVLHIQDPTYGETTAEVSLPPGDDLEARVLIALGDGQPQMKVYVAPAQSDGYGLTTAVAPEGTPPPPPRLRSVCDPNCPLGSYPESEACGDDTNGGCNSLPPMYDPINCGDTVCGTVWADNSIRDTDWYELTISEASILTWTASTNFEGLIGVVDISDCNLAYFITYALTPDDCTPTADVSDCLPPGTYALFVATNAFEGYPCPNNYVATLTCTPCEYDNDDCAAAEPITDEGLFAFDNAAATEDGPAHADCEFVGQQQIDHDVWFCWTASCTALVQLQTCGLTTVDTKIAVYDGCECPPTDENLLACNDDYCSLQSGLEFTAYEGQEYLIRVGTYPGADGGTGFFFIGCYPAPENDLCENAIPVAVPSLTAGTTDFATTDTGFPSPCGTTITSAGVWYTVMGTGNTMTASLCDPGTNFDTKITVYCAVDCDTKQATCVDGNDDYCGLQSQVSWCSQAYAVYYILVHGFGSATGEFVLGITDDGVPCSGGVECLPYGVCIVDGTCQVTTELGCVALGGTYMGDDTTCHTLFSNGDSFMRQCLPNRNEGANPRLKVRGVLVDRPIVNFDLTGVPTEELLAAQLVLTIDDTCGPPYLWTCPFPPGCGLCDFYWGDTTVNARRVLQPWEEGNGKGACLPWCDRTLGQGPGVTWNCAIDPEIFAWWWNCDIPWFGAFNAAAYPTAPGVPHYDGMTGPVIWDVTQDIRDAFNGEPFYGFLIKKADEGAFGHAWYYSREGAVEANDLGLAPHLLLVYDLHDADGEHDSSLYVSSNVADVAIAVSPGESHVAPFDATYPPGTALTLAAPRSFRGWALTGWMLNGTFVPSVAPLDVTLDQNTLVTAVYHTPADGEIDSGLDDCLALVPPDQAPSALSVSSNVLRLPVELSQTDLCGHRGGTGEFERLFLQGQLVTVTAPQSSGGNRFVRWVVDGVERSEGQVAVPVPLTGDVHTAVAVYRKLIASEPASIQADQPDRIRLP